MISINSNLSSLIVRSNLAASTNGLNQAIERMTTGYKINHAKDNAANYAISTSLASKLSSYSVAQDNVSMGLDMLTTAMDSLSLISDHLSRMRDLSEQAANGTYGASSLSAIQSEINARLAECVRIRTTTEYNGIKLYSDTASGPAFPVGPTTEPPAAKYDGFIEEVERLTEEEAIQQGYTVIKTADELQAMQNDLDGKYILMNDINLAGYDWDSIGTDSNSRNSFTGEFNGNGYKIKNLTINKPNENYQGFFGYTYGAIISNIGLENINITGSRDVGGLSGGGYTTSFINCYVTNGTIIGSKGETGGIIGDLQGGNIQNCYSTANIVGGGETGGIIGIAEYLDIINSYSTGNITNDGDYAGGLAGEVDQCTVDNCYATGNVNSTETDYLIGGLIGEVWYGTILNSYATGNVNGGTEVGGLAGEFAGSSTMQNCYSTGSVIGDEHVGGLLGLSQGEIHNSYTTSSIIGNDETTTGAFIGSTEDGFIDNCIYYSAVNSGLNAIGDNYGNLDLSGLIDGGILPSNPVSIKFQAGIHSDESSQILLELGFNFSLTLDVSTSDSARNALEQIDEVLAQISAKQTEYGAAYNRLESALESIGVSIDNLTSTQSTIRDADIAEESSQYIKMQILQQASATLLATVNQTPSIALQLL